MRHLFLAALAASCALACACANAAPFPQPDSSTSTQIGYKTYHFTIKPGQTIGNIAVPVSNRPIHLMVSSFLPSDQGVGEATLQRLPGIGLQWVGLDFASNTGQRGHAPTVTAGDTNAGMTHILYADAGGYLEVIAQDTNNIELVYDTNDNISGDIPVNLSFTY
jgi:hypothetical protein